jgi:hypothetical protein
MAKFCAWQGVAVPQRAGERRGPVQKHPSDSERGALRTARPICRLNTMTASGQLSLLITPRRPFRRKRAKTLVFTKIVVILSRNAVIFSEHDTVLARHDTVFHWHDTGFWRHDTGFLPYDTGLKKSNTVWLRNDTGF